jgi:hypothetical protein
MPIVTYPLNGIKYDYANVAQYNCTRQSGVYSADEDFKITISGDRQLTISPGVAWMRISRFVGLSVTSTEDTLLDLAIADSTRPRIDRIVLRYDAVARSTSFVILQGTAASSPTAPAITQTELIYDLCLADIYRPGGSTTVTASNITSTVLDESLCGVMRDGVTALPTAQLLEQASARVDEELANVGLTHAYMEAKQQAAEDAAASAETQADKSAASATAAAQSAASAANAAAAAVDSAKSVRYTITVPASGWSATGTEGSNTYYSNTVAVSGMTADVQLCCIELADNYKDNSDAVTAYRTWSELDSGADKVTFYSAFAPTADFAVTALEVR